MCEYLSCLVALLSESADKLKNEDMVAVQNLIVRHLREFFAEK
jgi:hypothetical protein